MAACHARAAQKKSELAKAWHALRQAQRAVGLGEAEKRRSRELAGMTVPAGDRLRKTIAAMPGSLQGFAERVVLGDTLCADRVQRHFHRECPELGLCTWCTEGARENEEHRFLACPAWTALRHKARLPSDLTEMANSERWPAALRNCCLVDSQARAQLQARQRQLLRLYAAILREVINRGPLPEPNELAGREEDEIPLELARRSREEDEISLTELARRARRKREAERWQSRCSKKAKQARARRQEEAEEGAVEARARAARAEEPGATGDELAAPNNSTQEKKVEEERGKRAWQEEVTPSGSSNKKPRTSSPARTKEEAVRTQAREEGGLEPEGQTTVDAWATAQALAQAQEGAQSTKRNREEPEALKEGSDKQEPGLREGQRRRREVGEAVSLGTQSQAKSPNQ